MAALRGLGRRASIAASALVFALPLLAAPAVAAPATTVDVKVMSFNILYGGDEVSLGGDHGHWCMDPAGCAATIEAVAGAIRASGADIVGMQEGTGNGCRIATALGWFCNGRLQVLSRFPLLDPPDGNGIHVFAEVAPGKVVALANVHLPSDPYGPYFPREGWTLDQVLDLEHELRMPAIQPQLAGLPPLAAAGIPVVLTGDFNSPSHLDWTAAVSAVRPVEAPYPIDWPVAHALADAGFRDSYRAVHPDPVADPGFTWTPGYPRERKGVEVHDRIDWVLTAGPIQALASQVVGESGYPGTGIAVDPWPSDHRGVVSTLRITPASPATPFASVDSRRLFAGDPQVVRAIGTGAAGESIAIVPAGGAASSAIATRAMNGQVSVTTTFASAAWAPRAYDAVVVRGGAIVGGRTRFHVYPPGARPTIATDKAVYREGEPIRVSWTGAPGWKWDWLAVTKKGTGNVEQSADCTGGYCGAAGYLLYTYTGTLVEGSTTFDATAQVGKTSWPIERGWYRIAMYFDDGYAQLGVSAPFQVVKAPPR
jgi:endonuclease/exonuclease/phosphatase family metal-dependent hydrolase